MTFTNFVHRSPTEFVRCARVWRFFAAELQKSLRIVFPSDHDPARLDMMRYIGPDPGPAVTLVLAPRGGDSEAT